MPRDSLTTPYRLRLFSAKFLDTGTGSLDTAFTNLVGTKWKGRGKGKRKEKRKREKSKS